MTVKERAVFIGQLANRAYGQDEGWSPISTAVADEISSAILEEREACAQIADVKVNKPWPETAVEAAKEIAWRIRARGESAPEVQPDAVAGD